VYLYEIEEFKLKKGGVAMDKHEEKFFNMMCTFYKKLTIHVTHAECDKISCYGCEFLNIIE